MRAELEWRWWTPPGQRVGSDSQLLPVGVPLGCRFQFDPALWELDSPFPDCHPIACTLDSSFPRRYVFLDLVTGAVSFQKQAEQRASSPMNSSIGTMISSIGIYTVWHQRMLTAEGKDPAAIQSMADTAATHLNAIEATHRSGLNPPAFWPDKVYDLASLL